VFVGSGVLVGAGVLVDVGRGPGVTGEGHVGTGSGVAGTPGIVDDPTKLFGTSLTIPKKKSCLYATFTVTAGAPTATGVSTVILKTCEARGCPRSCATTAATPPGKLQYC
jgi:hypothetical protein